MHFQTVMPLLYLFLNCFLVKSATEELEKKYMLRKQKTSNNFKYCLSVEYFHWGSFPIKL